MNQSINLNALRCQSTLNPYNRYLDRNMRETRTLSVQHVHDITFYFHQDCWIDSRLVSPGSELPEDTPVHLIPFGSDDYIALADRLAQEGRQGSLSFGSDVLLLDNGTLVVIQMSAQP